MRLALVEPSMYGGLLQYAVQMADGLAARGHDVDLFTPKGNELAAHRSRANMRAILTPPIRSVEQPESLPGIVARQAEVGARVTLEWARAVWEVRRGRYDAVILTGDMSLLPATLAGLALTARGGPATACIAHNVRIYNRYRGEEMFAAAQGSQRLFGRLLASYDLVFVHGERSRQELEEYWSPRAVAIIPHGDERIFGDDPPPPSDEERILFFGDWRKVKGLPVLMDAFDLLAARRPSVRLTIAGMPAPADLDPEPVRAWAVEHGDRVEVIDHYVPVEDVPGVFGRSRVVVTPYHVGYQSGVIHLAMTMARAVVTSDVGDLSAAVQDGETGIVVPPDDPALLADALERVVANPQLADLLGAAGLRRVAESANWDVVAEKVESAFQSLPGVPSRAA